MIVKLLYHESYYDFEHPYTYTLCRVHMAFVKHQHLYIVRMPSLANLITGLCRLLTHSKQLAVDSSN